MAGRIFDAVTAVLMCEGAMFVARRQVHMTSFPGFIAFPGGKVDKIESDVAHTHALLRDHELRLVHALFRELREELHYDLDAAFASGEATSFQPLGSVTTPDFVPVRFNTHFFRIDLVRQPDFELEIQEIDQGRWATPAALLQEYERGELLVALPTLAVIRTFAADSDTREIAPFAGLADFPGIPELEVLPGLRQIFVPSNTLPPADRTNCFLLGDFDAHRILVDPSPKSREEMERLCTQAAVIGFHEVFLTHHHPDHREFADEIARRFGVPIAMSEDTEARIRSKQPKFFDGLTVRHYRDGDEVTRWLGQPLRVIAIPGHDEGHLALMPDNRAFCIVGDLIQGVGTVVIAAPEGDMRKYFATLEKIIALNPKVIVPSHGSALGSVFYLEQTLKHRRAREAQVREFTKTGMTIEQMLAKMYADVDPRLMPLARMNIESHLAKLKAEALEA